MLGAALILLVDLLNTLLSLAYSPFITPLKVVKLEYLLSLDANQVAFSFGCAKFAQHF
jgi:hypothetical protein